MNTITLGMTGLEVTPVAFGTWQLGGEWGAFDEDEAVAAIRHASELGINFFDTAQAYGFGASERLLGRALKDELATRREEVVIATKGGLRIDERRGLVRDSSPAWLRHGIEESLTALGVDHIDLYQVHWPDPATPLAETAQALDSLVEEGKIRHVGVSNFDVSQMAEFARTRPVETLQPPYHLFRRDIEADVLPYSREHDIGVLVYGTLAHGLLTGAMEQGTTFAPDDWRSHSPLFKGETFERNLSTARELEHLARDRGYSISQLAIAWTLANPAVDVAIVGSRHASHIEDSVGALELHLSDEEMAEIDSLMSTAVAVAGPSPEAMP
ncbi:MAG: aldo/keto reductase [Actinobacteria bacterium]|nr:MAG: aldo/keto reductase [Actinomycetota bacterium]